MEIIGITFIDPRQGNDVADKIFEEERGEDRPLRHSHLYFLPCAGFSLKFDLDPPVPQICDEPTLKVGVKIGIPNFFEQPMVIDRLC